MSTISQSRLRPSVALGLVLALIAAMMTFGTSPASAAVDYAKVTGHEAFTPQANKADYWCANGGEKIDPGGSSYVLTKDYEQVIVKAGSGQYSNTIFAEPPTSGQTVWADTNGDRVFNPGGPGGDKSISHVILCEEITPPGTLKAVKAWTVTGIEGDPAGTPGTLTFNDDKKKWDTVYEYPTGDTVRVVEAGDGKAPDVEGYKCVLDTSATTYQVDQGTPGTTPPTVTIASNTLITVTITNTVNCTEITPPGTLKAVKAWTVTGIEGDPAGTPGTLTFNDDKKKWDTVYEYPTGDTVRVVEAGDGKAPDVEGYKCVLDTSATTYQVDQGTPGTTPPTVTIASNTLITVTITNTVNCTEITPPGTLKAVKAWTVTGIEGDPAGTPGTLTFNDDKKKWDTVYEYPTGDTVRVVEAGDGKAPDVEGYKCVLDTSATTYQVDQGTPGTTPPTVTIASNTLITVTITNTVNCTEITPPGTTLVVTKDWVYDGTPDGYPVLTSANAGSLAVTVNGVATGQAWDATQAGLKVGDKFTVTEGAVPTPPQVEGFTCEISGSPEYSVNGGAFVSPSPTSPLAPTANGVVVRNTVTCEVVEGIEEGGETPEKTPEETPDNGAVGGSEQELAETGANVGPAGLGLLLIVSGAALLGGRRFAIR